MALNNAVNAKVTGFQSLNAATGVWNGRTLTPGTNISITNQDGTGGDPVFDVTGIVPPPPSIPSLFDDFISAGTTNTDLGDTNWQTGSATLASQAVSGHPGVVRFSAQGGILKSGFPIVLGAGVLQVDWFIRINNVNIQLYIGLGDPPNFSFAEPNNGIYFVADPAVNGGQYQGKTSNGGVKSSANSANAVSTNWVKLTMTVNAAATSVAFFVDGVQITNSPLTTNIPTAGLTPFAIKNTTQTFDLDLFQYTYALTTPR